MSKKIHFSEQTKHKVSILPYFLRIGNIAVDRMDIYLYSQRLHSDKEYRFKNNKTINRIGVIFEDKQGEERKTEFE